MTKDEVWEQLKRDKSTVYGRPILDTFLELTQTIERRHLDELSPTKRRSVNPDARTAVAETDGELEEAIKDGASGEVALKGAADRGNARLVGILLAKNPEVRLNWPLWGAAKRGHKEVVELLVDKGANDFNWSVQGAIENGHSELAGWLVDKAKQSGGHVDLEYALHLAIVAGDLEGVKMCVDKGAIDIKEALYTASRMPRSSVAYEVVRFLKDKLESTSV